MSIKLYFKDKNIDSLIWVCIGFIIAVAVFGYYKHDIYFLNYANIIVQFLLFIVIFIQTLIIKKQVEILYKEKQIMVFAKIEKRGPIVIGSRGIEERPLILNLILSGNYGIYDLKLKFKNIKTKQEKEKIIPWPLLPQNPETRIPISDIDFEWDLLELYGKTQFGNIKIQYKKQEDSAWLKIVKIEFNT